MPFYLRTSPNRPILKPALVGGGAMLVWSIGQAFFAGPRPTSVLLRILGVLFLTVLGGALTGGLSWSLGYPPIRRIPLLRWVVASVAVLLYLCALGLGGQPFGASTSWSRVLRGTFLLSTLGLSAVLGWLLSGEIFAWTRNTERVYLTPAEFAALAPGDQANLRPDPTGGADPRTPGA